MKTTHGQTGPTPDPGPPCTVLLGLESLPVPQSGQIPPVSTPLPPPISPSFSKILNRTDAYLAVLNLTIMYFFVCLPLPRLLRALRRFPSFSHPSTNRCLLPSLDLVPLVLKETRLGHPKICLFGKTIILS